MDAPREDNITPEQQIEMEEELEDLQEDNVESNLEAQQDYGYPTADPVFNQHAFLHQAAFNAEDTLRTTFLSTEELGRPLFTVRFMLDLYKIALDESLISSEGKVLSLNKIAEYWRQKIFNVTNSGMSNEGFSMNLNVTQKKERSRRRSVDMSGLKNYKGGIKNQYGQS